MMKISIVLSFRNEEATISELINRLENSLNPLGLEYEIIFVNDASTDNSLKLLVEKAKTDKHLKVLNMSRRFGNAQCIMAGIKYAKGDAVVYMDSDLQDPPEIIPDLIKKWKQSADVVYTTRITRAGESVFKMWLTKLAYKIMKAMSDEIDLPLNSGDFKLLDRKVVDELIRLKEKDPYVRGLVSWLGFKQEQVLYHREKRFAGKTHFPLLGLGPIKGFVSAILSFSTVPLILSLLIGFFISLGAFLYLGYVIYMKFSGQTLPGWSAIMVTMLFLGGIQLFTLGVMGLYIGRIHNETKVRQNYIVESEIGF